MLFSIIVPVYNVEKLIHKCIDSLICQTYEDIEIILVDDGSTDNSSYICDEYADKDKRIRVIHKKNGGLSDARNVGIDIASGDYILFVDSDDYIETDTCKKLLKYTKMDCDIIIADAVIEGGIASIEHITLCDQILTGKEYLKTALKSGKAPMAVCLNAYKTKFLKENEFNFKTGILHEDEQFTPRVLLKAESVVNSNIEFYHYVIRDNSITTQKDKRKNANDFYNTACELEKIYQNVEDTELKKLLLDSLSEKYLFIFQSGSLHKCGREYLHKNFVRKNAYRKKTKMKAFLYCLSPSIYYKLNCLTKKKSRG